MSFYFQDLIPYLPEMLSALVVSIYMTVIAFAAGSALGVVFYLARASRFRALRIVGTVYVEVFRNTPLLVQLYLIYFGLPALGIGLNATWAAVVALLLNNAGYAAEIYRAGFEAVPHGTIEAGQALGLRGWSLFSSIRFMPATKNIFPALTNQFVLLFLFSSVASIIGSPELMNAILNINEQTYLTFEILIVGGAFYFIVSAIIVGGSRVLERSVFAWGR